MFDLFLFFHYYGRQDVCSKCRANKKSLPSIYLARGRFAENGTKNTKIFNIKDKIAENWHVWPIFIFSLLWLPGCVLQMSRKLEKFTVDLSR